MLLAVFRSEAAALRWIASRIVPGRIVNPDEAPGWDAPQSPFEMNRIDYFKAHSEAGAYTNMAQEDFSQLRRAEGRPASDNIPCKLCASKL